MNREVWLYYMNYKFNEPSSTLNAKEVSSLENAVSNSHLSPSLCTYIRIRVYILSIYIGNILPLCLRWSYDLWLISMATSRVSHVLGFLLWIFVLLFISKGLFGNFSSITISSFPSPVITNTSPPFYYRTGRRALEVKKFDFTPFSKDLHRSNHHQKVSPPGGSEIDPRYGVEKRLVPSGPNPLHHWLIVFLFVPLKFSLFFPN